MITGINHIGLVVKSIDETISFLNKIMDVEELVRQELKPMGQISCEVQFGDSRYELMEPYGDKGVVPDFFSRTGSGFHHISLKSDNFDEDIKKFRDAGVKIISISELNGTRYAFTHPKTSGGILYEIAGK